MQRKGEPLRPATAGDDASVGLATASLLVDASWRIAGWDHAASLLFGMSASEVLGHRCRDVVSCRDLYGESLCPERCPVGRAVAEQETIAPSDSREFLACDGRGRPLQLTASVELRPGQAAGHVLILLRRCGPEPGYPWPSAQRFIGEELREAIDDGLDEALGVAGAEVAEVFLRDRPSQYVSLAGFRGQFGTAFRQIVRFGPGEGYPGLIAEQGGAILAVDAVHDRRFLRTAVQLAGFRYFLCVPIPGPQGPAGSLHLASRGDPQTVLPHWLALRRIADRLGLAVQLHERGEATEIAAPSPGAADDRADDLTLRCLGRFSVWRNGAALSPECFARRRALRVLKILLTRYGCVVSKDELIELLWPDGSPDDAPTLLKVAVHYLRRGLQSERQDGTGDAFILTQGNGYAFNSASRHRWDVLEFERAADEGERLERCGRRKEALVSFAAAAAAYTGDYLEDEPYSDWCAERRHRLQQTYLHVLRRAGSLAWAAGDAEAAVRSYRRALAVDRCLEDVHRELMAVLWRSGRRTEALAQYEICRTALREEIDITPVPETVALYQAMHGAPQA
ncbi:MAG: BTAD domain-containing putative transcriptional regulator [Vulcanimicrobiaceae bacterium]